MITQELQTAGAWDMRFSGMPQSVRNRLTHWTTLYVLPTPYDSESYEQVTSVALYAGVILTRASDGEGITVSGRDLGWYLGDGLTTGARLGEDMSVDAVPTEALAEIWDTTEASPLLPLGAVFDPPVDDEADPITFTAELNAAMTLREILDLAGTVCSCSWRVNPDGTVDFGPAFELFRSERAVSRGSVVYQNVRSVNARTLQVQTSGDIVSDVTIETPDSVAEGRVLEVSSPKMWEGQELSNRGTVISSPVVGEDALTPMAEQVASAMCTVHVGARAAFRDRYVIDAISVGDTAFIHDPDAIWPPPVGYADAGALVEVHPLVTTNRAWTPTEDMGVVVVEPYTTTPYVQDVTRWVVWEEPSYSYTFGLPVLTEGEVATADPTVLDVGEAV